jgi:hypothetical protein
VVNEREPEITTDEIRAGQTTRVTRYVLAISLVLVVAIFAGLLILYR